MLGDRRTFKDKDYQKRLKDWVKLKLWEEEDYYSGGYSFILNHHETLRELEILEVHEPRTIKKLKSYPLPGPCTMKQYETILETILMNHKKGPRNNARSILPNEPF